MNTGQQARRRPAPYESILSYKEAIVAMYQQFIIADIYNLAERRFEAIRYNRSKGGVSHLYNQMIHYKDCMFLLPTEYKLHKKFVNALPHHLQYQLTVSRGLHVRTNKFAQFVNMAKVLEDAMRALDSRGELSDMCKNDKKVLVSKPTHSSHKEATRTASAKPEHAEQIRQQPTRWLSVRVECKV